MTYFRFLRIYSNLDHYRHAAIAVDEDEFLLDKHFKFSDPISILIQQREKDSIFWTITLTDWNFALFSQMDIVRPQLAFAYGNIKRGMNWETI